MKAKEFLLKIKKEFPELKWKSYKYFLNGWDHYVLILDRKIVFRSPKSTVYKEKLKEEIHLLRYLTQNISAGIPEYIFIASDNTFAGYNFLAGQDLSSSKFIKLSSLEKKIVARQLAEFITVLHKTPEAVIKKYKVGTENYTDLYADLVKDTEKYIFPRLDKKDVKVIRNYLAELENTLNHKYINRLIHNDLGHEHLLWDKKQKKISIIDFSDRIYGDPAADFAGLFEYGMDFVRQVFDLYKGSKDDNFLQRAQLYFKRVPLYIMKDSMQDYPCTFQEGYNMFKKRFNVYRANKK